MGMTTVSDVIDQIKRNGTNYPRDYGGRHEYNTRYLWHYEIIIYLLRIHTERKLSARLSGDRHNDKNDNDWLIIRKTN